MERTVQKVFFPSIEFPKKKKTAAYARVSSGKDSMLHSLAAQISYYSALIQSHSDWEYCGVYADEAITGTKDDRAGLNKLLDLCRDGLIDQIITKSVSRFARNTVDLLQIVRELKDVGIDIYFEEQNIHTLSADGELMLTVLASFAQEESLSASENQKWRIKRNFEAGLPWNATMLGYRCIDGTPVIIPEEAEIVRFIYSEFLSGKGYLAIAKELNKQNIVTRRGNAWGKTNIAKILRNPTYTGNLVLQRYFCENYLTKKTVKNRGQLPMYKVKDSHEAIISTDVFIAVQTEIANRAKKQEHKAVSRQPYLFTSMIKCAQCGKHFMRKNTAAGPVWICTTFNSLGKSICPAKQIPEATLMKVASQVLLSPHLSADLLHTKIEYMLADNKNKLVFYMKDKTEKEVIWSDRSRSESWTPEMRKKASERIARRNTI